MTGILVIMDFGEPFGGCIPGARGAALAALMRTGAPMTGRQIHRVASGGHSLWSIQEALKALAALGLVETAAVGRAVLHSVNDRHVAAAPLRRLADPISLLREAARASVGSGALSIILFGSVARHESGVGSDIDLAVISHAPWDGAADLQSAITAQFGNACDVLVFTEAEFARLAASGEPVVEEILRDGIPLLSSMPTRRILANNTLPAGSIALAGTTP
ncbi:MAG: nucleotidyltransferase domain-containing protein [Bifidobacteriaceae bacterium]|jgi:predicted nucleotidyltransferase|nr:nucleotidyltransferase domain-containing protein [Bifidobacteriaceae bacterium]